MAFNHSRRPPARIGGVTKHMSFSRRFFIKIASGAALAAGIGAKPSLAARAQDLYAKGSTDPLAYYNLATFTQYLNSIFRLRGPITVDVPLTRVEDILSDKVSRTGGRESFVLHFRAGTVQVPQATYTVEHAALGSFKLFLVPAGTDENGEQWCVATINRLTYTGKPIGPLKPKKLGNPKAETALPEPQTMPGTKPVEPKAHRRRESDPDILSDY